MNISYILVKFWQGKISLVKSYWIVGELFNAIVLIIIFNFELILFENLKLFNNLPLFNIKDLHLINKLILIFWSAFITVGIWRSAEEYKGRLIWIILTLIVLSYRIFVLTELII